MALRVRFVAAAAGVALASAFGAVATGEVSADPQPSTVIPGGWAQTHSGNGDRTWKRDGQQIHLKVHAFTGTLDDLVSIIRRGAEADSDGSAPAVADAPVKTCGGTLSARRITIDTGSGKDRVIAEMTVAVDGANVYEASYLRLASAPAHPEAHAAVMGLCVKRT